MKKRIFVLFLGILFLFSASINSSAEVVQDDTGISFSPPYKSMPNVTSGNSGTASTMTEGVGSEAYFMIEAATHHIGDPPSEGPSYTTTFELHFVPASDVKLRLDLKDGGSNVPVKINGRFSSNSKWEYGHYAAACFNSALKKLSSGKKDFFASLWFTGRYWSEGFN